MEKNQIKLSASNSEAIICPDEGGRIKQLKLNGAEIITPFPRPYRNSYASSILFPFANRINKGIYNFKGDLFNLKQNMPPNAIHGLVYNRRYKLISTKEEALGSEIELEYNETNSNPGFPFCFKIRLNYSLEKSQIRLKIRILNTDENPFPFSLGWHPYFYTSDMDNSYLKLQSSNKFLVDENMIPTEKQNINWNDFKNLKNEKFDDGFELENNDIEFRTPDYHFKLTSSIDNNYVQIYTPKEKNFIAIEPMTSPADSFNNKIGLMELGPNQTFEVEWRVELL